MVACIHTIRRKCVVRWRDVLRSCRQLQKGIVVRLTLNQTNTAILLALILIGLIDLASPRSGVAQSDRSPDESQEIETYLRSLHLDKLMIEFLEFEMAQEINPEVRHKKAARLLNLYAERMISRNRFSETDWLAKSSLLLRTYPGLSTPSIRLAILQSRYLRSEELFNRWWKAEKPIDETSKLIVSWNSIKTELESLNRILESRHQAQLSELFASPERRNVASRQRLHTENLLLQTNYLIGWSTYFLGILDIDDRRDLLLIANHHFREFLQLDPQTMLMETPPSWFDFSSDWSMRALAGLAMCQRGLRRVEQSEFCFELIRIHALDQANRDLQFVWDLNSRLYVKDYSAVGNLLKSVANDGSISEGGRITFWKTAMTSGIAVHRQSPETSRQLMRLGLAGLARDFQAPLIQQFLEENRFTTDNDDFLSHWIAGYLAFNEANLDNGKQDLQTARTHLNRAIELKDSANNQLDIACCRYLLARINFERGDYQDSADAFLEASRAFGDRASELAVESQWLAIRSLSILTKKQPSTLFHTHQAIDDLLHRFPGSTYASKATFEKLRVNLAGLPPLEAIKRFEQVTEDDPNYPVSQFEILNLRFGIWLDSHHAQDEFETERRTDLLRSEHDFQQIAQTSQHLKLKAVFLVVDALLRDDHPDFDQIRKHLDRASSMLDPSNLDHSTTINYHYYEFLFASRSGSQVDAMADASWIVDHAPGTPFEQPAMIYLAQTADKKLKSMDVVSIGELQNTISIFERLVELTGRSENALQTQANARVAFARLAKLKMDAGQTAAGVEMFETLARVFPNHQSYLLPLAQARMDSKAYDRAAPIWRRLASGVKPGTDIWFESKWQLATCLFHLGDRQQAERLYEQTLKLTAELPARWRDHYRELSELLDSEQAP